MEQTHVASGVATATWWKRENLLPGLALLILTVVAWVYSFSQAGAMHATAMPPMADSTGRMAMPTGSMEQAGAMEAASVMVQPEGLFLFLVGWAVMMIAMMLPAALPLILLYRTIARKQFHPTEASIGMVALLVAYIGVWTIAGLPVYAYSLFSATTGPFMAVVPGILLIVGGIYQFTALKHGCHTRCSNPLFFLVQKWKPGVLGAVRLGILHGADCLGCCVGLMLALIALGMMNVAWMLTAAVIIFVEKTLPNGHRIARPLGVVLVVGGMVVLGVSLLNDQMAM